MVVIGYFGFIYYGYGVEDFVECCSFEEVVYFLFYGELFLCSEFGVFELCFCGYCILFFELFEIFEKILVMVYFMDVMCIGVLFLGNFDFDVDDELFDCCWVVEWFFVVFLGIVVYWWCFVYDGVCFDFDIEFGMLGGYFFELFCGDEFLWLYEEIMNVLLIFYVEYEFNVLIFVVCVCVLMFFDYYFCIVGVIGML